ncbi:MAG: BACON domain-containing protein, partial [Muribaculaceae bacterium]|nr:BACON domain-containing protein [Muribaculaceae bacterium]
MQRHQLFSIVWFIALSIFIVCGGCSENEERSTLSVSKNEIEIGCDGETLQIEVAGDAQWSAAATVSWITLTPTYGSGSGTLEINVLPNTGEEREGEIRLFKKEEPTSSATVIVRQAALGEHTLSLSPMVVALEDGNLEAEVEISASIHGWSFEIIDGGEWMDVSKSDNKLSIVADPLKIPHRSGQIDITSVGKRLSVYVIQGDFRKIASSNINAVFYGQLSDMPYTTGLINVTGEKYPSPYVGQDYQDQINIQFNQKPIVDFGDFRLNEGKYPISLQGNDMNQYCSAGFFDDNMGVYGSCWLRRWYYMGEDYGYNGFYIFQKGNLYISKNTDRVSIYLLATGLNQEFSPETFTFKIEGTPTYIDATNTKASFTYDTAAI